MLPQLQERIAGCEGRIGELDEMIRKLAENLSELREQLQVERNPRTAVAECAMPLGAGFRKY